MSVVHYFLQIRDSARLIPLGYQAREVALESYRRAWQLQEPTFDVTDVDGVRHTFAVNQFVAIHDRS